MKYCSKVIWHTMIKAAVDEHAYTKRLNTHINFSVIKHATLLVIIIIIIAIKTCESTNESFLNGTS